MKIAEYKVLFVMTVRPRQGIYIMREVSDIICAADYTISVARIGGKLFHLRKNTFNQKNGCEIMKRFFNRGI